MWVDLPDGRTLGLPLAWFPRLLHATPVQREAYRLSARGMHWADLDEDISIAGLLAGRGDQNACSSKRRRRRPGDRIVVDVMPSGRAQSRAANTGSIKAFFTSLPNDVSDSIVEMNRIIEDGWAGLIK